MVETLQFGKFELESNAGQTRGLDLETDFCIILNVMMTFPEVRHYKLAFPCDSNGNKATKQPATMNNAPLVYTGAEVSKFANMAMIGCKYISNVLGLRRAEE